MADKPVTREEKYLAYLTGDYTGELPKPITRKEKYLYELCLKGIGGEISPEEIKNAVNEHLEKNPVKPGATTEQAQQIEQNKTDITSLKTETNSLKEDLTSKADKTALVKTDRKLDALWKLNQGISYEFQTDEAEAYQKTVPSGAKMTSVKSIGGKTIVWNQLLDGLETEIECICENPNNYVNVSKGFENNYIPIVGHNYFVSFEIFMERTDTYFGIGVGEYKSGEKLNNKSNAWTKITRIVSPKKNRDYGYMFYIFINAEPRTMLAGESFKIRNVNVFDLTQMFGSGNEPSTPEEFEAMFPADYYPYNAGELMSAPVNEVVEQGRNLFDCYGFSCTSIPNIAGKRDIANDYGTTISIIDPTNRLIVTQNKADGSSKYDFRNGYFNVGIRGG